MFRYYDDFLARVALHYEDHGIAMVGREYRNLEAGKETLINVRQEQVRWETYLTIYFKSLNDFFYSKFNGVNCTWTTGKTK